MFSVDDFLRAVPEAILVSGNNDMVFKAASIDSRKLEVGQAFFAIRGSGNDGHDYISSAIHAGATGVVVESDSSLEFGDVVVIQVPDTLASLHKLTAYLRYKYSPYVLAITGSVGKTTTKDLVGHVLAYQYRTEKSAASYNNQYGIPLTVSKLIPECTHLVLEIGANHVGEIAYLSGLVKPDAGIITNIGWAHVGSFGSLQNTLSAKTEIVASIREGGTMIVNGDDDELVAVTRRLGANRLQLLTCGFKAKNDIFVSDVSFDAHHTRGIFHYCGNKTHFALRSVGEHMVYAALYTYAAGVLCGLDADTIVAALASFQPTSGRFALIPVNQGVSVVDDSYNASPDAVMSALRNLQMFSHTNKIAVLGEMKELGNFSEACHAQVGKLAAETATHLIVMESSECGIIPAAIQAGLNLSCVTRVASAKETRDAVQHILDQTEDSTIVLVKGARFTHMERVVLGLVKGTMVECNLPSCERYDICSECPYAGGIE